MSTFQLEGSFIEKTHVETVGNNFHKREFVIEIKNERDERWNDYVKFQLTQDRTTLIDQFNPGDILKVSFNIRGRKWEKDGEVMFFNTLEAWRIEGHAKPQPETTQEPTSSANLENQFNEEAADDLPF